MRNRLNKKKSKNFIGSVIGMNFEFLFVYLPWSVVFFIHHTENHAINDPNSYEMKSFVQSFWFQMIYSICDCISYLNNLMPFFFNLAFNSIFRREFSSMLNRKAIKSEIDTFRSNAIRMDQNTQV